MRMIEIFLIEVVVYLLLYVLNDYFATMLSLIFGGLSLLVLLFSLMFELVEKSKVPRSYFTFLIVSLLAPIVATGLYIGFNAGLSWMGE